MVKPELAETGRRAQPASLRIAVASRYGSVFSRLSAVAGKNRFDFPHTGRFARRRFDRVLRGVKQFFGVETRRQPLKAHGRDVPVAVASRPSQQIQLLVRAFNKRCSQLVHQRRIIAGCRGQSRIEGSAFIRHTPRDKPLGLRRGLSM